MIKIVHDTVISITSNYSLRTFVYGLTGPFICRFPELCYYCRDYYEKLVFNTVELYMHSTVYQLFDLILAFLCRIDSIFIIHCCHCHKLLCLIEPLLLVIPHLFFKFSSPHLLLMSSTFCQSASLLQTDFDYLS